MIQGRVDRKEGGRETGRGNGDGAMGGGNGEGETGMGRWERLRWGDGEEDGKVEKSWQGPGVGRKGGDRIGTIGRRLGGGNGEGKIERGQREGGDGRGAKGMGRRRGKRRRHFTDGYDSSTWNAWVE